MGYVTSLEGNYHFPKEMRLNDGRCFVVVQFFLSSLQPGKAGASNGTKREKKWWKMVKGKAIIRFKFIIDQWIYK